MTSSVMVNLPGQAGSDPESPKGLGTGRVWLNAALFSAVYYLCAELGRELSAQESSYVSFWLPAGLYVGTLLLHEPRYWWRFLLLALPANLLFDLRHGTPLLLTIFLYAANSMEALTGALLTRQFVAGYPKLASLREMAGLAVATSVAGAAVGATVGGTALLAGGFARSWGQAWWIWWSGEAVAILLVMPFMLACFHGERRRGLRTRLRARLLEVCTLFGGLTLYAWYTLAMTDGIMTAQKSPFLLFIVWAALRLGASGATAANLWLALLVAFLSNFFRTGLSLHQLESGECAAVIQTFLGTSVLIGLVPSIMLEERERREEVLRESERRFRILTEAAFEGVVISQDGVILDINDQGLRMLARTRDEVVGRKAVEFASEESKARVGEAIAAGKETPYEFEIIRKDNAVVHVEGQARLAAMGARVLRFTAIRDITANKRASERIETALREKERLLREIHHRVKNNMQVVSSLLQLQSNSIQSPELREVFKECQGRIRTMAAIHEKLYHSEGVAQVDFKEYLETLVPLLVRANAPRGVEVRADYNLDPLSLDVDTAVPLGLIVNELIVNSLKHAFREAGQGVVRIALRTRAGGEAELVVGDDGCGLPEDCVSGRPGSLGLRLVTVLARQIGGTVEYRRAAREFSILFGGTEVET